jgi:predicted double-glycine peptidase
MLLQVKHTGVELRTELHTGGSMNGIGDAVAKAGLEAQVRKLDELSDGLQEIILKSSSMREEQKAKLTEIVAQRQGDARVLRTMISALG